MQGAGGETSELHADMGERGVGGESDENGRHRVLLLICCCVEASCECVGEAGRVQ